MTERDDFKDELESPATAHYLFLENLENQAKNAIHAFFVGPRTLFPPSLKEFLQKHLSFLSLENKV
jgi:hypothetical protein